MTWEWPSGLEPLRKWAKENGIDVKSIKSERQAAFLVQSLANQRFKFPARGELHFPLLKKLQDVICAGTPTPRPVPTRGKPLSLLLQKRREADAQTESELRGELRGSLVVFCDGCCEPNPGTGGWGVAIYRNGIEVDCRSGGVADTTNNSMELTGLLMALAWLATHAPKEPAIIFCDSQYVVKGLNEWMPGWKRKGWSCNPKATKEKNSAIANFDLWKALDAAKAPLTAVKVKWVKGHDGFEGNERARRACFTRAAGSDALGPTCPDRRSTEGARMTDDDENVEYRSVEDLLRDVPLWRRRLDTWTGRLRGDNAPVTFYFGTGHRAALDLKPSYPAGMLQCSVFLDERYVATLHGPVAAVLEVAAGKLDGDLGFSAKAEHVPDDIEQWAATPIRSGL